ncbi:MAG TPA: helix-turn-helix domain-containing protein [Microbacteriaceae bacterium]
MSLSDVLDAVRVGSEFIWNRIVQFARSTPDLAQVDLVRVAGEVWAMSDSFATLLSAGYHEQQELRIIEGQRERYALIQTVLSGHDQPNATLWEAIDRIGLPRDHGFVVAAVEHGESPRIPMPRIDHSPRKDAMESAWLLRSDVELGIVSTDQGHVPAVQRALEHYGVRAGISPIFSNFGDMPQTVRLARTALAAAPKGQVYLFADSAVGTMAAGAPEVAAQLTSIVLNQVLELPDAERQLILTTARTWFDAAGSTTETARRMFVHPNTVRNRLRRLETLTLRSLSDPRQAAEVCLAVVALAQ